eukprot:4321076-Amphidinium_carterae.1
MHKDYTDVLVEYFVYIVYTIMTKFRMVAERVHQLRAEPLHQVHQQAELGQVPSDNFVYSALLVKPTFLDPTSWSTMTWSTSTRCRSDINMLTVPKQQPHRRDLPTVFEGNKQDQQQGSMTTFKNWAAEVQICMSLEDQNLATVMVEVKTQTVPINDAGHIDHQLHQQGPVTRSWTRRRRKNTTR